MWYGIESREIGKALKGWTATFVGEIFWYSLGFYLILVRQ
jgi:hypothetical protein